jgi:hypothetical protein
LSADDFSAPRDNLSEDEQLAPDHLRKYLRTQIAVLDDIVAVFNGEGNRAIETGKYRDASIAFVLACGKDIGKLRVLAIRWRWCSRQSLQTQPRT